MDFSIQVRIAEVIGVAIVLGSAFRGYNVGLVKILFGMIRLVLITLISLLLSPIVVTFIPDTIFSRYGIAFSVSFFISILLVGIVSHILGIVNYIPIVKHVNRIIGALVGFVVGLILIWLIFIFAGSFQTSEWCNFIVSLIKGSELLMFVQELNPIPRVLDMLGFPTI